MQRDVGLRGLRRQAAAGTRRHKVAKFRFHRPRNGDQRRQQRSGRQCGDDCIAAPRHRRCRGDQERERHKCRRLMIARHDEQRSREQVSRGSSRRYGIDATSLSFRAKENTGDKEKRREGKAGCDMKDMRSDWAGLRLRKAGQCPEQAERHRRNGKPAPQANTRKHERRCRDHREINVERPIVRCAGGHQQRRGFGADKAERRQRRTVQQRGRERCKGNDAQQNEGHRRTDEAVEFVGGKHCGIRRSGACGRQDAWNMRRRQASDADAVFLTPQPFAAANQSDGEQRAEGDPHAGADQSLLDRIAHQKQAAERKREAADPHDPTRAELLFEVGLGNRRQYWRDRGIGPNRRPRRARSSAIWHERGLMVRTRRSCRSRGSPLIGCRPICSRSSCFGTS